jgi:hypothetical protein
MFEALEPAYMDGKVRGKVRSSGGILLVSANAFRIPDIRQKRSGQSLSILNPVSHFRNELNWLLGGHRALTYLVHRFFGSRALRRPFAAISPPPLEEIARHDQVQDDADLSRGRHDASPVLLWPKRNPNQIRHFCGPPICRSDVGARYHHQWMWLVMPRLTAALALSSL